MKKATGIILAVTMAIVAVSCSKGAKISGSIDGCGEGKEIVIKALDVNRYQVVDTVKTDAKGNFTCNVEIEEGQPEFVYIYLKDKKIASLILTKGDNVKVSADTLGKNLTIEGSEESLRLQDVEKAYATFSANEAALATRISELPEGSQRAAELSRELTKNYIEYYRDRIKYILSNPYSLSVVPVFYQNFGEMPLLSRDTDAILFQNASDSLATIYPDSKYIKALKAEAKKRFQALNLNTMLEGANEVGFPDIVLPDIKGEDVKLSEVDAKVILVMFWLASEPEQKMFNLDFIAGLYDDYASKGLQIYQVSLDADKTVWAQAVKNQKPKWISVCDSRSGDSPYVTTYNLTTIPSIYMIADGEFVNYDGGSEEGLRKTIEKYL